MIEHRYSMLSEVRVRPAREADAAILSDVGVHSRPFTPERVRADGFGPQAAFMPLILRLVAGRATE